MCCTVKRFLDGLIGRSRWLTTPLSLPGLLALLVFAAGGGAGYALADANSTTINACVGRGTGTVRIIAPSTQSCTALETATSWNQTGPQGPTGPPGPTGPQGPPGPGTILSALVRNDGTFVFQNHGAYVRLIQSQPPDPPSAIYQVGFDRDVSRCIPTVTQDPEGFPALGLDDPVIATANSAGAPGDNSNEITVRMYRTFQQPAPPEPIPGPVQASFNLVVYCP
jgi:hypothetical protein